MTMVFATIFFSIVLSSALASLSLSLDEARRILRAGSNDCAAPASRRRIRVSRPAQTGFRSQSLRAAA